LERAGNLAGRLLTIVGGRVTADDGPVEATAADRGPT